MHGLTPEEECDYWRERARRAEAAAKLGNEIAAKVNDAVNRAGIHCALYYWEAIDQIAKERDEARAEVKRYRSQLEELTWIANGLKAAGAWKPEEVWREEVADEVAELSAEDMEALRWARECIVRGLKRDSCYDADGNPPPGFTMISRALAVLERLCGGKDGV